ncbi:helix-turn-helix transcriptional regulator [Halomonas salifodinae]|uniref:Helix-turn-helix transcriptional regulator n=1 Tax=Halomonas salifodinae TaxID=438745 RepID=A0ABW2F0F7_9GAMM
MMLDDRVTAEIRAAELWLDNTTTQACTISELATYLGYSESHIRRHFLRHFGMGPARYRNTLRLERTASLLLRSRARVIDIATSCGFRSHAIFSRAFQHHFGISPSGFRRRHDTPATKGPHHTVSVAQRPAISLWAIRHYGLPNPPSLPHLWQQYRGIPSTPKAPLLEGAAFLLPDDPAITPRHRQRVDIGLQGTHPWPPSPYHRRLTCPGTLAASIAFDDLALLPILHAYLLDHWLPHQPWAYNADPVRVIQHGQPQHFELQLPLDRGEP